MYKSDARDVTNKISLWWLVRRSRWVRRGGNVKRAEDRDQRLGLGGGKTRNCNGVGSERSIAAAKPRPWWYWSKNEGLERNDGNRWCYSAQGYNNVSNLVELKWGEVLLVSVRLRLMGMLRLEDLLLRRTTPSFVVSLPLNSIFSLNLA